mgnify:CR=1 FL=1
MAQKPHPTGSLHTLTVADELKVTGNKVTVLVDQAVRESEAKEQEPAIRKELETVLAQLRHPASDEQFTELLDQRLWCQSRLRLAGM